MVTTSRKCVPPQVTMNRPNAQNKPGSGRAGQRYQGYGDRHVRKTDDEVGDHIGPEQTLVAQVAIPVREKIRREKGSRAEPDHHRKEEKTEESDLYVSREGGNPGLRIGRGVRRHPECCLSFAAPRRKGTHAASRSLREGRKLACRGNSDSNKSAGLPNWLERKCFQPESNHTILRQTAGKKPLRAPFVTQIKTARREETGLGDARRFCYSRRTDDHG